MKELERENGNCGKANEILELGVRLFCPGGSWTAVQALIEFIDEHR